ncbi:MAG: YdcH family protein [Hyphomicrobiaceae bacterium]
MHRRDDRELRELLVKLRDEHRSLDAQIVALELSTDADQLTVKRLKKRKLLLKDQIKSVEDRLTPDIIA